MEKMSSRATTVRKIFETIKGPSFPPPSVLYALEACCMVSEGRFKEVEAILDKYFERDFLQVRA